MAVLLGSERARARSDFTMLLMAATEEISLTRPELQAAIDATDAWIDANAASFNAALPLPARAALTTKQKARLFMAVAKRRYEVS
jgi:hypothetical protein